ncbi:hypothetical protein D7Z26_08305 [Cohnella endophytica]|uniref:SLH domain-containing protein n=1 Tax=Cohnella endophytica TaxID=2419778 RepID=A0A494XZ29_9BACL|nr:S-layer homology domain-containing protein [Cohnella endophytica]RKP55209.1 hypothetical protein D7Z26_08305 [Cohnella endophytica]
MKYLRVLRQLVILIASLTLIASCLAPAAFAEKFAPAKSAFSEQWRTGLGASVIGDPYIGAEQIAYVPTSDGNLVAVRKDGSIAWRYPIAVSRNAGTVQIAQAADGTLYVGSGGNVYSITSDGSKKWEYESTSDYFTAMVVQDSGYVHLLSSHILINLNPSGIEESRKAIVSSLWSQKVGGATKVFAVTQDLKPIFSSNKLTSNRTFLVGELLDNGNYRWQQKLDNITEYLKAISDEKGNIYFSGIIGSSDSPQTFMTANDELKATSAIYSVNAGGAKKLREIPSSANSLALGMDGTLYVASFSGTVYALDATGAEKWKYVFNDQPGVYASYNVYPRPEGGLVIPVALFRPDGTDNTRVSALISDQLAVVDSGGLLTRSYDNPGYLQAAYPTDKTLYFKTYDGLLSVSYDLRSVALYTGEAGNYYAYSPQEDGYFLIGSAQGSLTKANDRPNGPSRLTGIAVKPNLAISLRPGDRITLSTEQLYSDGRRITLGNEARYASSNESVVQVDGVTGQVLGVNSGTATITATYKTFKASLTLTVSKGKPLTATIKTTERKWQFDSADFLVPLAVADSTGNAFSVSVKGQVKAFGPEGNALWTYEAGQTVNSPPVYGSDHALYIGTADGKFIKLDSDKGTEIKTHALGGSHGSTAIDRNGTVYAAFNPPVQKITNQKDTSVSKLYSIDANNALKWTSSLTGRVDNAMSFSPDGTVLYVIAKQYSYQTNSGSSPQSVVTAGTLYALDASNGSVRWKYEPDTAQMGYFEPVVSDDGSIAVALSDGIIVQLDASGKLIKRTNLKRSLSSAPISRGNELFVPAYNDVLVIKTNGTLSRTIDAKAVTALLKLDDGFLAWSNIGVIPLGNKIQDKHSVSKFRYDGTLQWTTDEFGLNYALSASLGDDRILLVSSTEKNLAVYRFNSSVAESKDSPFSDMIKHWARKEVSMLAEAGIVAGFQDGTFRPNAPVSREQFAKMLAQAAGAKPMLAAKPSFQDVPASKWSFPYIEASANGGWFKPLAYGDKFEPAKNITRVEAAIWTAIALKLKESPASIAGLKDRAEIRIAPGLVGGVVSTGLMSGTPDGKFKPAESMTRAEAAVLIQRVIDYKNKQVE